MTKHLHHARSTNFFTLIARYIHRLISPNVPRQVAVVEKSGSIFAANKVSEETQAFLRNHDQNLSIRSISIPCLPLKIGFTVAIASKQAGKVKKKLQDENVSLERNMEWN